MKLRYILLAFFLYTFCNNFAGDKDFDFNGDAAATYRASQQHLEQAKALLEKSKRLFDTYYTYSFEKHVSFAFTFFCVFAVPFNLLVDTSEYGIHHYGLKLDENKFPNAYAWIKKECAHYGLPEHVYVLGASLLPHEWLTPLCSSPPYTIDTPLGDMAHLEILLVSAPDSPELDRYRAAIYIACTNLISGIATQQERYLRKIINYTSATMGVACSSAIPFACEDAGLAPKIMHAIAFCFAGYKAIHEKLKERLSKEANNHA